MIKKLLAAFLLSTLSPSFNEEDKIRDVYWDWSVCNLPEVPQGPMCPGISQAQADVCRQNFYVLAVQVHYTACTVLEEQYNEWLEAREAAGVQFDLCIDEIDPGNQQPCFTAWNAARAAADVNAQIAIDVIASYVDSQMALLTIAFWACIEAYCEGPQPPPLPPLPPQPFAINLSLYGVSNVIQPKITPFFVIPFDKRARYATITTSCPCKT